MLSRMMTRREQLVLIIFAVSILIGAGALLLRQDVPVQETPLSAPEAPAPAIAQKIASLPDQAPPEEAEPIGVAIMGAVQRPGLYYLPPDTRVGELLTKAGGTLPGATVNALDLTAPLLDGTTLSIPGTRARKETSLPPYQQWNSASTNPIDYLKVRHTFIPHANTVDSDAYGKAPSVNGQIDINTASQSTLETLPGIGPVLAQRIIAYRENTPFHSLEELQQVSGIGPGRYQALTGKIRVQ